MCQQRALTEQTRRYSQPTAGPGPMQRAIARIDHALHSPEADGLEHRVGRRHLHAACGQSAAHNSLLRDSQLPTHATHTNLLHDVGLGHKAPQLPRKGWVERRVLNDVEVRRDLDDAAGSSRCRHGAAVAPGCCRRARRVRAAAARRQPALRHGCGRGRQLGIHLLRAGATAKVVRTARCIVAQQDAGRRHGAVTEVGRGRHGRRRRWRPAPKPAAGPQPPSARRPAALDYARGPALGLHARGGCLHWARLLQSARRSSCCVAAG